MAKDEKDTQTVDFIESGKRAVGRPAKYSTDAEKKAARALAARTRRAKEKADGIIEVRIKKRVQEPTDHPESEIIDLSKVSYNKRSD